MLDGKINQLLYNHHDDVDGWRLQDGTLVHFPPHIGEQLGEWIDVGKGNFRVTKCSVTGKQRMLVRNSVGKITFNAAFYKGMNIKRFSKDKLSFGVVVDDSGLLRNFILKLKDCDIEGVLAAMQAAIGSL